MKKNTSAKILINTALGVSLSILSVCTPVLEVVAVTKSDSSPLSPKPLLSLNVNENILKSTVKETSDTVKSSQSEENELSSSHSSDESSSDNQESSESSSQQDTDQDSSEGHTESSTSGTSSSNGNNSETKPSSSDNQTSSSSSSKKPDNSSSKQDSSSKPESNGGGNTSSTSSGETKKDTSPITYVRNRTTGEFVEEIGEDAREIAQNKNLYASVMIAQAILESGSGNSSLARTPNYNLFGIKGSYKGESVEMATLEDSGDGGLYTVNAKFRKYPSYKESLEDYAMLMSGGVSGRSTFYQGAWKSNTQNYKEATKYLTGRYASDSRYNEKLNGLIETYDLTQYDSVKPKKETIEKTKETEAFIKDIAPKIEAVADKNDLYASVLIAEAVIKSNSGLNELSEQFNVYQVTGKNNNQSVKFDTLTTDAKSGKTKLDTKEYKVYSTMDEAIDDYIAELKKDDTIYHEMTRSKKDTSRKVTAYLTAQNKEDRRYHKRLNGLIDTYNLTQYDKLPKETKKEDNKSKPSDMVNELGINMVTQLAESFSPTKLTSLTTKK
ncbi:glucosaminidase domain-containing protein [Vagococcus martis]|uniref:glucosaminidase domain-containing protein n=1 Tax=Vagococcus martis TaxID=1768210 RepID=UPI001301B773|nr:glucosaminidase domain-containing protein [Vagococcus martis]